MSAPRQRRDEAHLRTALEFAARAYGQTAPNPMVGAVLVKAGKVIGQGWHHRAGQPHAEIEALRDAERLGHNAKGATLYVTLEPCSTHGRTPPCTDAIISAGIARVVAGATDPNPRHAGHGFTVLRKAGIDVVSGLLEEECQRLNRAYNHWIVERTPFVTVKAAMTLDGKIATAAGESKWITGPESRAIGMHLRQGSDAVLVGVNTVLADDPALTVRSSSDATAVAKVPRRIVLDSDARTPLTARLIADEFADRTLVVVTKAAPARRVAALRSRVTVWVAPERKGGIDLRWVLKKLGKEEVTSLLVEGGGEVNASFLFGGFAHRVAFFYAPKVIGGSTARKGVAGDGIQRLGDALRLTDVDWRLAGEDLVLMAKVG